MQRYKTPHSGGKTRLDSERSYEKTLEVLLPLVVVNGFHRPDVSSKVGYGKYCTEELGYNDSGYRTSAKAMGTERGVRSYWGKPATSLVQVHKI